jgi:putative cell wall-binding protein
MDKFDQIFEQFKVHGKDLADKIRELIHEGNVRRIIVKDESGHTFVEIPLTVATIGIVAAPILAAVGAIATLVAKFEVVVERTTPPDEKKPAS